MGKTTAYATGGRGYDLSQVKINSLYFSNFFFDESILIINFLICVKLSILLY